MAAEAAKKVKPVRLSVRTAAKMLDRGPDVVRALVKSGVLTGIYPDGQGQGKKTYVVPGEVRAYGLHGLAGVVAYRAKQSKRKK